jgi:hypothetical protein
MEGQMRAKYLMAGALLMLEGASAAAQSGNIGGRYNVLGTNIDGTTYKGTAEIVITSGNTCRITWRTGTTSMQQGICMRNASSFSAAYMFSSGKPGLVIYEIQPDGSMKGLWTIADVTGVGGENLIPTR